MPDLSVVELTGRTPRGRGQQGPGCFIVFGALFMAAGASVAWRLTRDSAGTEAPLPVIYAFGGLAVLFGFSLVLSGLKTAWAAARRARIRRQFPNEPWRADHRWDERGERERPMAKAISNLIGMVLFALLLAPFNWLTWVYWNPVAAVVMAVFDLMLVAGVVYAFYEMARAAKYGAAWIEYERFPFFLGEPLRVRLGSRGGLDRLQKLLVTVRFVREAAVPGARDSKGHRSSRIAARQHWAETLEFDPGLLRGTTELPVGVDLPADADYGTELSAPVARYWEIEMKGEAPGIDFHAQFLIPVYAR